MLNLGAGSRALGMGSAYVAIVRDASAGYWNPAGLGQLKQTTLATTIISNGNGMNEYFGSCQTLQASIPVTEVGTIGIIWMGQNLDGIEIREIGDFSTGEKPTETFSQNAFLISYGHELLENQLFVGASYKIVNEKFYEHSAMGIFGLDIGLLYFVNQDFRIGMSAQSSMNLKWDNDIEHVDRIPESARAGIAYTFPNKYLTIATDLQQSKDTPINLSIGAEFYYQTSTVNSLNLALSEFYFQTGIDRYFLEKVEIGNDRYDINNGVNFTLGLGMKIKLKDTSILFGYAAGFYSIFNRHRFTLGIEI